MEGDFPNGGRFYKLDADKRPIPVGSLEWASWFQTANRIVAKAAIDNIEISTVFLGLDHAFGDGPPLLFETMIFGGEHDGYQARCSTWKQAEEMHESACAIVRGSVQ